MGVSIKLYAHDAIINTQAFKTFVNYIKEVSASRNMRLNFLPMYLPLREDRNGKQYVRKGY